jgi:integrase
VPRRGTLLRSEQTAAFLAVARQDFYHPLWDVAVATGFRRGEVLGLRWRDLDLARGTLTVRHTVIWISKPSPQERAKTDASYRTIRILPDVIALLRAHEEQQGIIRERAGDKWEDSDLVFCTRHGRPLSANNVHRTFKVLLAAAGLPHTIKIHDLRHTNLSHLLNNGVPITTVARRGGYRNPNVLLRIYAHADAEQDAIAADVASALTQGAPPKPDKHE